ncbi:MAG: hypothetical protein ABJE95_12665 [Byssovorax sp.]
MSTLASESPALRAAALGAMIWAVSCAVAPAPGAPPHSGSSTGGGSSGCDAADCLDACQEADAGCPCDPSCVPVQDPQTGPDEREVGPTLIGKEAGGAAPPCVGGATESCPHSLCGAGAALAPGCDNAAPPAAPFDCVSKVCAALPGCCSVAWDAACVAAVPGLCMVDCGSNRGACAVCYKDTLDHDGDGYAWTQGDCADCDPGVNPGAHDYPGNGLDEDCSGTADDEPATCDSNLAMASDQALDFASAIDLCKTTTDAATGIERTWGVVSAGLVQADGAQIPSPRSHGILGKYGPNNLPQRGKSMAAFSTGAARAVGDPGWVNPDGQLGSFNQGTTSAYPAGFPDDEAGCPGAAGPAHDSTGLLIRVRVPTNARSFSYRFNYFSPDYPERACTAFADAYVALLQTGYLQVTAAARPVSISFDAQRIPVGVNAGFFTTTSGAALAGTGLDGLCDGQICGGSTGWLRTSAPVVPGETITLQLSIWDAGDPLWDSTVLVDDWAWSPEPTVLVTARP